MLIDGIIGHWDDGENEEHGDERAKEDDGAHRHPQLTAACHHRQNAHRSGCRGKENGAHTSPGGMQTGIVHCLPFFQEFVGIIEHDDAVAHQYTQKTDDTHDAGAAEVTIHQFHADGGARQTQGKAE